VAHSVGICGRDGPAALKKLSPISEDDEFIRAALRDAHLPTLVACVVHLTGDTSLLERDAPLVYEMGGDGQGGIDAAERAQVRERALSAIIAYRDAGCPAPAVPSRDDMRRLMDFITGSALPDPYVPFMLDELGIAQSTTDTLVEATVARTSASGFRVVIIGAGMSGILAAHRLQQLGVEYVVIEKNAEVGGTWLENTYPGCRVDSSNHGYCYSFEPKHDWPHFFSTQDVLLDYFRGCADRFGVREHIRFETEVVEARHVDATGMWSVQLRDASGAEETLEANAVISAVGQLNRPSYPDIPGREDFGGVAFHSARWRHDVDLTGKRVAVIGTGASAFQFVPEIADQVGEMWVYQRTPPWLMPTPNYHEPVPAGVQWLMSHLPLYDRWYRFFLMWMATDGLLPHVSVDPTWDTPGSVSASNQVVRELMEGYVRGQCAGDPSLAEAAIPAYAPGGKRMLRDNGVWLPTLQRDDVHLITDAIERITQDGIVTADGELQSVDVIIYGTGFEASRFLQPMKIIGRDGADLHEHWAGDARAYLGITVPRFPNLFCLYGPNTNIVVNGSIIFFSECAVHYILGCIRMLVDGDHATMECKQAVHDQFNERVDAQNQRMAWGTDGVTSWYKNALGRVSQNWPFGLVDYWNGTRAPEPADFELRDAKTHPPR